MNFNMIKDFAVTNYKNHEEKYLFLTKVFGLYFLPHLFLCVFIVHLLSSVCVTEYECTFTISYKNNKLSYTCATPVLKDQITNTEEDLDDNLSVVYEEEDKEKIE